MYGEQAEEVEEEEDKTEKTHGMADTLSLVELVLFSAFVKKTRNDIGHC